MSHADFLVWMFGAPIFSAITDAIKVRFIGKEEYSKGVRDWAAITWVSIYVFVAIKLY